MANSKTQVQIPNPSVNIYGIVRVTPTITQYVHPSVFIVGDATINGSGFTHPFSVHIYNVDPGDNLTEIAKSYTKYTEYQSSTKIYFTCRMDPGDVAAINRKVGVRFATGIEVFSDAIFVTE